jgi:bis(5'-nucleosyl)-tetraphosphatase (symmetrical)
MALYLIGDIQGCHTAFTRLLQHIDFSPSRDRLFVLGDLVNRGPDNAAVLRQLMAYDSSAVCLLGNHDLHMLAVSQGVRQAGSQDTFHDVLNAPDREAMLHWLRHRHLAWREGDVLMVHAGVLPPWSADQTLALAAEVQQVLQCDDWPHFLSQMYGGLPNVWDDGLQGADRLRIIVNALTRLRFCDAHGAMDFSVKESADKAPPHLMPWFEAPQRRTRDVLVAFGHWSTLGTPSRDDVVCLDDGCVWGGCLSALRLDTPQVRSSQGLPRLHVKCEQVRDPLAVA